MKLIIFSLTTFAMWSHLFTDIPGRQTLTRTTVARL